MKFKIAYEIKGQRRKELVEAISNHLNTIPRYLGVPNCAYEIGNLIVDREGSIIINDTMTLAEVDIMVSGLEEEGFISTNYGENAFEGIEVSMPRDMFIEKAMENLHKTILAKGELIAKTIGSMELRIIENDVKVRFPCSRLAPCQCVSTD